jgi:hypothetical protein
MILYTLKLSSAAPRLTKRSARGLHSQAPRKACLFTLHNLTVPNVSLDYNKLLELIIPSSSTQSQIAEIQRSLRSVKPRQEAAQKAETGEMMNKLKGLGDSLLGNAFIFTPVCRCLTGSRKLWLVDRQLQVRAERSRRIFGQLFTLI